MIWTVPDIYYFNHYLNYATVRFGYNDGLVHLFSDTSPEIDILEPPFSISDFDTYFYITDQCDSIPPDEKKNIAVHQYTFAWSDSTADDFIIYDYWIVNLNDYDLTPFFVAFHADCDISAAGGGSGREGYWMDDLVGYYRDDMAREYISYMFDGDSPIIAGDDTGGKFVIKESSGFIGSRLLYCPLNAIGDPERTQTGHHWWDSDNEPSSDDDWYRILSDGRWLQDPQSPHEYKYLQKTGPFLIPSNDSIRITFAFGIGEGITGLRDNLLVAQGLFDSLLLRYFEVLPRSVILSQNYPNPFNSFTTIEYGLAKPRYVKIEIYDILGRQFQTLQDERMQAGFHTITFDASNLASGVYFYRLQAGDISETRKMILLK
jgi:hypothetical protein